MDIGAILGMDGGIHSKGIGKVYSSFGSWNLWMRPGERQSQADPAKLWMLKYTDIAGNIMNIYWTGWPLEVPPNPNDFMTLWFYKYLNQGWFTSIVNTFPTSSHSTCVFRWFLMSWEMFFSHLLQQQGEEEHGESKRKDATHGSSTKLQLIPVQKFSCSLWVRFKRLLGLCGISM